MQCTLGDKVVDKLIKASSKPIRFVAALDDGGELLDAEIVTTE